MHMTEKSRIKRLETPAMPAGFRAAGFAGGIKADGEKDMAMIFSEADATAAGAFTTNRVAAAPVWLGKKVMVGGSCRAIVVNSGCANACTGPQGEADAIRMADLTALALGINPGLVAVCSTGRIGKFLPMEKIEEGIAGLAEIIRSGGNDSAAEAIMTTDTHPKQSAVEFEIDGRVCRIWGITKGAGMIYPRMSVNGMPHATMLAFLLTDLGVDAELLRSALSRSLSRSFNRITVDGDTSTNDTVILMANGESKSRIETGTEEVQVFQDALDFVTGELARMITADGEGATRLIKIEVRSASSREDARLAAAAVANSLLFKCALYGESPNWGRLLAALGYSGALIEEKKIEVSLNGIKIVENGLLTAADAELIATNLREDELNFVIELGLGEESDFYYTCDISSEYVEINKE
jgi:glutamate N-acetyltransferase / amino-acid N-acetyltransferase